MDTTLIPLYIDYTYQGLPVPLGLQCPLGFRVARAESPESDALEPGPGSLTAEMALAAFHTIAWVRRAKGTWGDTTSVLPRSSVRTGLGHHPPSPLTMSTLFLLSNALQPKEQANILTDVDCSFPNPLIGRVHWKVNRMLRRQTD